MPALLWSKPRPPTLDARFPPRLNEYTFVWYRCALANGSAPGAEGRALGKRHRGRRRQGVPRTGRMPIARRIRDGGGAMGRGRRRAEDAITAASRRHGNGGRRGKPRRAEPPDEAAEARAGTNRDHARPSSRSSSGTSRAKVSSMAFFLSSHSQMTCTCHPSRSSKAILRASRSTLRSNLGTQ